MIFFLFSELSDQGRGSKEFCQNCPHELSFQRAPFQKNYWWIHRKSSHWGQSGLPGKKIPHCTPIYPLGWTLGRNLMHFLKSVWLYKNNRVQIILNAFKQFRTRSINFEHIYLISFVHDQSEIFLNKVLNTFKLIEFIYILKWKH